ncbi:hypothetical protein [Penaeicola halotolerans]|uniref:hypothetical protein n=1 Tax=Penaeicola halotolerans TaxID=2793196 RepID=UPI001CF81E82|nr:hypothetical protein [Penaeicola halotolerans]
MAGLVFLILFYNSYNFHYFILFLLVLLYLLIAFIFNLSNSSFIIFFPVIGVLFSINIIKYPLYLNYIFWGTLLHIILGIFLVFSSYLSEMNNFVHPLYDKGVPFLHAPKGFTSTVQTFTTLCVLCLLIYYYKLDNGIKYRFGKTIYLLISLAIVFTFNRNYLVVLFIIYFFKEKRFFYFLLSCLFAIYITFFDFFNKLILNTSTLSSRGRLLEAFREAFFERANIFQYTLGHGNNIVDQSIAIHTYYKTGYIENGLSVLIFTYGGLGFLIYICLITFLIYKVYKKNGLFYAFVCGYIFFIAQQFTHEFFSTSFYLMLSFFIYLSTNSNVKENNSVSLT